jgi:hypothetical protein
MLRGDLPDRLHHRGLGGADDQAEAIRSGPGGGQLRHALRNGRAIGEGDALDLLRCSVGGAAQHPHPASLPSQERFEGVPSQIRAERDRPRPDHPKRGLGVPLRTGGDVAAFGIEDHRDLPGDPGHHLDERLDPIGTKRLEERRVRLEGRRDRRRRRHQALRRGECRRRAVGPRIDADAEPSPGGAGPLLEHGEEASHALPSTIASSAMRTYMPYSICRK